MGVIMPSEITLLIIGLAMELVFVAVSVGVAVAVFRALTNYRLTALETLLNAHLSNAPNVEEDITKIKVWLRLLLKNQGIEVDDDL